MTDAKAAPRRDRFPILLGAAVALVLLAVGAAGLRSWRDLAAQRAREAELEGAIAATEADVARLEERIERLGDDAPTLERLARHDLGMVRPDDTVFVFPAELSGKPGPAAPARPVAATPAVPSQQGGGPNDGPPPAAEVPGGHGADGSGGARVEPTPASAPAPRRAAAGEPTPTAPAPTPAAGARGAGPVAPAAPVAAPTPAAPASPLSPARPAVPAAPAASPAPTPS